MTMPPGHGDALAAVANAADDVKVARAALRVREDELRETILAAAAAEVSVVAIAKAAGLSRARVYQILRPL